MERSAPRPRRAPYNYYNNNTYNWTCPSAGRSVSACARSLYGTHVCGRPCVRGAFFANVAAYGYGTALSMVAVPAVDYWVLGHRRQVEHVQTKAEDACSLLEQECFLDCVQAMRSDVGKCQYYSDLLNECRRSGNK